jgi:hypothetical protein
MLPVLIVCYLRPEKLEILLRELRNLGRKIYIFIDRANIPYIDLNSRVFEVADKFKQKMDVQICWSEKNQGVGHGVPSALNWVFEFEDEVIVLEDDCLPTKYAYNFFDEQSSKITGEIVMACGTSPWQSNCSPSVLTLANYPLIWGWSTNLNSWIKLRRLLESKTPHMRVLKTITKNPLKIKSLCFFYAAVIRVNRGKLKAWDSPVALEMLLSGYKSIVSNKSLIENSGQDQRASHFSNSNSELNEVVSSSQTGPASNELVKTLEKTLETNRQIEKFIYSLKVRNIFSPLKAFIGL